MNKNDLIVVFDLDNTLIHCHTQKPSKKESIKQITIDGHEYWIELRKGMKESLNRLKNHYRLVLYTASQDNYVNEIMKVFEQENISFNEIYSRNNCELKDGKLYKNIDIVGKNKKRIVCIDDNPRVWNEMDNVYSCRKYYGGSDDEFVKIESLISSCNYNDDVRDVIYEYTFRTF